MIPVGDTLEDRGGFAVPVVLVVANTVLFALGLYGVGIWTFLVSLLALWLFGRAVGKKAGPFGLVAIYLVLLGLSGLIAGQIDGTGPFLFFPAGAALGLGLALLALAPRAKIATLIPIPFAMGLYEVPAVVIFLLLGLIAILLNGA